MEEENFTEWTFPMNEKGCPLSRRGEKDGLFIWKKMRWDCLCDQFFTRADDQQVQRGEEIRSDSVDVDNG